MAQIYFLDDIQSITENYPAKYYYVETQLPHINT